MECNENRKISLIAHAAKILLKIIKKRITPIIESKVSESQLGFRKGKGTREAIYITRIITERALEKKKPSTFVLLITQRPLIGLDMTN